MIGAKLLVDMGVTDEATILKVAKDMGCHEPKVELTRRPEKP